MQGSLFFTLSLTQGIALLVKDPYKGIKARSPQKITTGLIRGAAGLLGSPLIGILGFVAKNCDGLKATTHLLETRVIESRCRPRRYQLFVFVCCVEVSFELFIIKTQIAFSTLFQHSKSCKLGW